MCLKIHNSVNQNRQSKSLGQIQDSFKKFLVLGYEYCPEVTENSINEVFKANIVKSILFNGKTSYKIVQTDSNDNTMVYVPHTQIENSDDEKTDADTFVL